MGVSVCHLTNSKGAVEGSRQDQARRSIVPLWKTLLWSTNTHMCVCSCASAQGAVSTPTGGRPRRHGTKFVCADPTTWPTPTDEWTTSDPQYGRVRVRAWGGLHAIPQNHDRRAGNPASETDRTGDLAAP